LSDAFVNYLALLGWAPDGESTIISRERLSSEFSLDHVSKNPAIMDPKKLDYINAEYLHALSDQEFADTILIPQLHAADLEPVGECLHDADWYDLLAAALKPRTTLSPDVIDQALFLYVEDDELEYDEKSVKKWLGKQGARAALDAAEAALADVAADDWTAEAIETALEPLPEALGMGKGKVFQPVRVACVGSAVSPGIGETLALLGRDHTLARIARAKDLAA
jgi:glutamyl-tRNA synthetase